MRSILLFLASHWSLSLAAQAAPEKMQAAEVGEGGRYRCRRGRCRDRAPAKCSSRCVRPA